MSDPLNDLRSAVRDATGILAEDYAVRVTAQAGFDGEAYFIELRRMIESRAQTVLLVAEDGPMGGGGLGEA